jgi:hypothetical protein
VTSRLVALLALGLPSIAAAHPGHGHTDPDTWRHWLTEPVHLASIGAVTALAVAITVAWRRARAAR